MAIHIWPLMVWKYTKQKLLLWHLFLMTKVSLRIKSILRQKPFFHSFQRNPVDTKSIMGIAA
ncbi:hypothetical protein D9O95_23470 [Salmonella enterica subsp. enterica]|nr:hypothetical protein [Salmonella enterica subsp. enterica serovar Epalinges]